MRLLIESDDYGITPAAALGALEAIRFGLVRNTGIFINMPWSEQTAAWIRPYLDRICFGIDLNLCAGAPCAQVGSVPSLVAPDGRFYTSGLQRSMDEAKGDCFCSYEDVLREFDAQITRFTHLFGRRPEYLHTHSYHNEVIYRAYRDCASRYGIPFTEDVWQNRGLYKGERFWYQEIFAGTPQEDVDVAQFILEDRAGFLKQQHDSLMVCHCGFVDEPLLRLSSYTLIRTRDLEAMTSERVREWVRSHDIELITYRDLLDK
jgi:predicted glycoside hydrolase/deacetylase ChbG (UPF0249 family)